MIEIGCDETGLGSIAGPVVVAAVVLDSEARIDGVTDSKKLTDNRRRTLAREIHERSLYWVIAQSSALTINRRGISPCHKACIRSAVTIARHFFPEGSVFIDGGFSVPGLNDYECIIRGDQSKHVIGAASIIAKVYRDSWMEKLSRAYPKYCWDSNKGYGTQHHIEALKEHGVTREHRKGFAPVRKVLLARH